MDQKVIATIGAFDGVHLGHQALFSQMRDYAARYEDARLVILTSSLIPLMSCVRTGVSTSIRPTATSSDWGG